uniref:Phosphoserine aminotransferase n=1 Tax=Magnetococcus massalia (strain MO-1) TaxID=451514 RepID=A0A1S7LG52_MAGMO|nr:Phosphoserine aminotransferase [Candidatus Magnetococcus massalia]
MSNRPWNFYPGPGAMPLPVLERVQRDLINYNGSGLSIMEFSHRSDEVVSLIHDTLENLRRLMALPSDYELAMMQGGGTQQFTMIALNFAEKRGPVDYINTGYWTQKAIQEAKIVGCDVHIAASSEENNHTRLPSNTEINVRDDARYLHICSNNTVYGTQWHSFPDVMPPTIVDMSSDILSRKMDYGRFGCIYAHAQKTVGTAGVTIAAVRKDMLERVPDGLPSLLDYRNHINKHSNYHTPPVFAIYMVNMSLQWLEQDIGGVANMEAINDEKAKHLYEFLDESTLFKCPVDRQSRSVMNVVFDTTNKELTEDVIKRAKEAGIVGINGHRERGGLRASLYNAVSVEAVKALVEFLAQYERKLN